MQESQCYFAHRNNLDGSRDSICTSCFHIVHSGYDMSQRSIHEDAHHCMGLSPHARSSTNAVEKATRTIYLLRKNGKPMGHLPEDE